MRWLQNSFVTISITKFMAHGTHCHCMMCALGKKMGMIRDEQHDDHGEHGRDNQSHKVCEHCGHAHKENDHCDCGCK